MLRKIGKVCISTVAALLFAFATWYFPLIDIPECYVQGTAAPTMTKEEAHNLMNYHGVKVIWAKNGEWVFSRNNQTIPLKRRP